MTYINTEGFKDAKIAITGGAGFIGSHLVERLLLSGAEVTVIDNFLRGNKLESLIGRANLVIHEADIRDTKAMSKILKGKEIVFHLAAVVGVEETQASPFEVLDVEIRGTENIFNAIVENKIGMIVFGSSSEVYGDTLEPMKEEAILSPKSTYAVAKLTGEEYCKAFNQRYGVQYAILRYFNVYGPRQDERFVISRFIARALASEAIRIYGDSKQTRDFTNIDDAVNKNLASVLSDEAKGQAINIGTGI